MRGRFFPDPTEFVENVPSKCLLKKIYRHSKREVLNGTVFQNVTGDDIGLIMILDFY